MLRGAEDRYRIEPGSNGTPAGGRRGEISEIGLSSRESIKRLEREERGEISEIWLTERMRYDRPKRLESGEMSLI